MRDFIKFNTKDNRVAFVRASAITGVEEGIERVHISTIGDCFTVDHTIDEVMAMISKSNSYIKTTNYDSTNASNNSSAVDLTDNNTASDNRSSAK